MKSEARISPPHSIILIMDFKSGRPPETLGGQLVAATPTCVAVGTMSEQDGETTVTLTDEPSEDLVSDKSLAFDGSIAVHGRLSVVTALNEDVLSVPVPNEFVRVRIWVNDNSEPNRIVIVAG